MVDLGIEPTRTRDWMVTKVAVRPARRLGRRGNVHIVDWQHVQGLTPSGLAMPDQGVAQLLEQFVGQRAVEVAEAIRELPDKRRYEVVNALDDERLADVLQELPEDEQADMLRQLPRRARRRRARGDGPRRRRRPAGRDDPDRRRAVPAADGSRGLRGRAPAAVATPPTPPAV